MKQVLEGRQEELAELITKENGKLLVESRGEIRRAIENIEVAIAAPMVLKGEILRNVAQGVDVTLDYFPIGPVVIVCPFNFPAMIPFWFLPHALITGNTCVVKPSELAPLTVHRIVELFESLDLPPGVLNLVHGDRTTAEALLGQAILPAGVASVGSTPAMKAIAHKAVERQIRFCCQGGAKNFLVVMPDANLDNAIPNIVGSVFGNAGQRCLAGSNVVLVGKRKYFTNKFRSMLGDAIASMKVGDGLDPTSTMGPVISEDAKTRILGFIEQGTREGATLLFDGRNVTVKGYSGGHYLGPTVFTNVDPRSTIAREEIFGPVMNILFVDTLQDAIALVNSSRFGNAASIYTVNIDAVRTFKHRVQCGNLGVNIGVPAPIAFFPFAGMKESFMGVLHGQSTDALRFFTDVKVCTERA